jgi:hypothetical protein
VRIPLDQQVCALPGEEIQKALQAPSSNGHIGRSPNFTSCHVFKRALEELVVAERHRLGDFQVVFSDIPAGRDRGLELKMYQNEALVHGSALCADFNSSVERGELVCADNKSTSFNQRVLTYSTQLPRLFVARTAAVEWQGGVLSGEVWFLPNREKCVHHEIRAQHQALKHHYPNKSQAVFVISRPVGRSFFHGTLEGLSRLAPYYEELISNPDVLIHFVPGYGKRFLHFLGFPKRRLVFGTVQSPVVLSPDSTHNGCGLKPYFIQRLRTVVQKRTRMLIGNFKVSRNILVVTSRLSMARITNAVELLKVLQARFPRENVQELVMGSEQNLFKQFLEAKIIIIPYGNSASMHMIASRPGTTIIEILSRKIDHGHSFVMEMSGMLGFNYEAISSNNYSSSSAHTSVQVDVELISRIVQRRLKDFTVSSSS